MNKLTEKTENINQKIALEYYRLGWTVLPLPPGGKCPNFKYRQYHQERPTEQQTMQWWARWPEHGLCALTGAASGIVVIDCDGQDAIERARALFPGIDDTVTAVSGSGDGRHFYFRYPAGSGKIKTGSNVIGQGIDVRADGGLIVLPPSVHKSGNRYRWDNIDPAEDGLEDLAEIPGDLLAAIQGGGGTDRPRADGPGPQTAGKTDLVDIAMGVDQGARNDSAAQLAGHYARQYGGDCGQVFERLQNWNTLNRPPLDEGELARVCRSICDAEKRSTAGDEDYHQDNEIAARLRAMNREYACILNGGQFSVLREVTDPIFKRPDIKLMSKQHFLDWHANDQVRVVSSDGKNTRDVNVASLWLQNKKRRQYEDIIFAPGESMPEFYNLYRGLAVIPRRGDWSLMRSHIQDIVCGGDIALTQWVLAWMARIVQDPGGERPGTAIVLRGAQGCGKGAFVSNFGKIFGSHYVHVKNMQHLVGRFNNTLKDAIFVFVDEGFWVGNQKAEAGVLRTLITEENLTIEFKMKDKFDVRCHINLMMASNSNWVVPAGVAERRFAVLDVSDARVGDRQYFNDLFHQMSHGGREAMLHDLLHMDISGVDLRDIPKTQALIDQIVNSMGSVERFWFDCLWRGRLKNDHSGWPTADNVTNGDEWFGMGIDDLYEIYLQYCKTMGDRFPKMNHQFSKRIGNLCTSIRRRRENLTADGMKKRSVIKLPPLEVCRRDFAGVVCRVRESAAIDWPDTEDSAYDEAA